MLNRAIVRTRIRAMPQKGDRSKRRRPRKGFPHRVAGYLDGSTHDLVAKAAEMGRVITAGQSSTTWNTQTEQQAVLAIFQKARQKYENIAKLGP